MQNLDQEEYVDEDDEAAEAVQAASNAILHLKELQAHPGWAILLAWVEAQIKNRTDQVMLKAENGAEEIFMKGEVTAFRTFRHVADTIIADRQYEKELASAGSESNA